MMFARACASNVPILRTASAATAANSSGASKRFSFATPQTALARPCACQASASPTTLAVVRSMSLWSKGAAAAAARRWSFRRARTPIRCRAVARLMASKVNPDSSKMVSTSPVLEHDPRRAFRSNGDSGKKPAGKSSSTATFGISTKICRSPIVAPCISSRTRLTSEPSSKVTAAKPSAAPESNKGICTSVTTQTPANACRTSSAVAVSGKFPT
mmetsp:Transcript_23139/g.80275  ORF Transcript_23139/g.80275 Transcript_23139/m.80275 type:complete len:214 (-) Transcript_23139:563-1204(-)